MQYTVVVGRGRPANRTGRNRTGWATRAFLVGFFAVATLFSATAARADDPLVPDVALEAAIRFELGVYGRDLTTGDLEQLQYLDAGGAGVVSLEGLQHCTSIETLILPSNQVADVLPLTGLYDLRYLDLSDNQITDISHLTGIGSLMAFNVSGNQVSGLSVVEQMGMLRWLDASDNQVADIDALENLALQWVDLGGNLIADISPLAYKGNLAYLDLSDNQIAGTPALGSMGALEQLDLSGNQLAAPPTIDNANKLVWLDLADNHVADLGNLQSWGQLRYLDLGGNDIEDVSDLSNLGDLMHLDLSRNDVTDISNLNNNGQLTWLSLGDNGLSQLPDLGSLNQLRHLDLSDNLFVDLSISWPQSLEELDLSGNLLENISNLGNLDNLLWLDLSDNQLITASGVSGMEQLEQLDLSGNRIESAGSLWGMDELRRLDLSDNLLTNCSGLNNLMQIEELSLRGNRITSLSDLPQSSFLWLLDASWNCLSNVDQVEHLESLEELYLCGNYGLDTLYPLRGLTHLRVLDADQCGISNTEPLRYIPTLDDVSLAWNSINEIAPLAANLALGDGDRVDLRGNGLDDMALNSRIPYLRFRGVEVLYDDGEPEPLPVTVRRSVRYGLAGTALDDINALTLHVEGEGLRDVSVVPPWGGDALRLSEELGDDWARHECLTFYRGSLSIFTWTDGERMHCDLTWEGLTDMQWDGVRVNDLDLGVVRGPFNYSTQAGFNDAPMPEQEPCVLAPSHRDPLASGNLTVQWTSWTDSPAGACIEARIDEVPFGWLYDGTQYGAALTVPAGPAATWWTPSTVPASQGYYQCATAFVTTHDDNTDGDFVVQISSATESRGAFEVTGAYDGHGNTAAEATPVTVPSSTVGGIEYWGDQDVFALEAVAGTTYDIRVTPDDGLAKPHLPPMEDPCLWLYDTDGLTRLAWDDDGGFNGGSRLTWTAPANGTYFLAVDSRDVDDIGRYMLDVDTITLPGHGPTFVYDHPAQHVAGDNKLWLLAVASSYTGPTGDDSMSIVSRMDVEHILDGSALDRPEMGRAYCRGVEDGMFVPGGYFVYVDQSNARKDGTQDRWSDLVVLSVNTTEPQERVRHRLRLPYAGAVAVSGLRVYVATQLEDDDSRVYIEACQFDTQWTNCMDQGISEPLTAPDYGNAAIKRMAAYNSRLYCLHDDLAVMTVYNVSNAVPLYLGQVQLDEPAGDCLTVTDGPVVWIGQGWSLYGYNVANLSTPYVSAYCDMAGRPGRVVPRGDNLLFVGVAGVGVQVVDLRAKPNILQVVDTFAVETATGDVAVARNRLFVPTGRWQTAVFNLFDAWVETDHDWVYQNTQTMINNTGGHVVRMEVVCRDYVNTETPSVQVDKVPGSGDGEVVVENDPYSDPLVKLLVGSLHTDGIAGAGPLELCVTVTGNLTGPIEVSLPMLVRKLGDIDGNGGVEPADTSLLISRLNGSPPPGYEDWVFDLDSNGAPEPADTSLLLAILNRLTLQ